MAEASPFYGLLCLRTQSAASPPGVGSTTVQLPELHLNIWEQGTAFLDVGLMLDVKETCATFELLLPWEIQSSDLEDLSGRLFGKGAVPAIFNEAWSTTVGNGTAGYVTDTASAAVLFSIIEAHGDLQIRKHAHQQFTLHSVSLDVAALRGKSMTVAQTAPRMYVRFRVKNVPPEFYRVGIDQKDRFLVSSWQRTEIIDFRLNVRRGVPLGLESSLKARFVDFSKVHLFLMRARHQDIVFEDNWFRACRSLEDENFWASYSLPSGATDVEVQDSRKHVRQSLGYQWTRTGKQPSGPALPIREFAILARFKTVEFGIGKFIIIALLVGALGNAIWDGVKFVYDNHRQATAGSTAGSSSEKSR